MFLFLILNLIILAVPLSFSFGQRIRFVKSWRFLFPAILVSGFIFIVWDHFFTLWGVWSYSGKYILGWKWWSLPVERWVFYFSIPYAGVFTYELLNYYVTRDYLQKVARPAGILLMLLSIAIVFYYPERLYTSISALLAAALLFWHHIFFPKPWLSRFWLAYFVCVIPFFAFSKLLHVLPVLVCNTDYNLDVKLFAAPVEDLLYLFDLLLLTLTVYEKAQNYISR